MSSSCGKKAVVPASKKKKGASSSLGPTVEVCHPFLRFPIGPQEELFQILQTLLMNYDDPGTVQFRLGRLVCQLSVPKFGTALGLYTEEFKEENDLHALNCHIHHSPSWCWDALVPGVAAYNPSRSKALALPPSLRHVIDCAYLLPSPFNTRRSGIGRGSSPLAPM
ncbi:hypothetical protein PVK06_007727 [Gossypium arboreum]|uniref:Uncharacterized protein n=1 Tax=Gossypium arboreum TaxID=29729 RepID=A0ABR0QI47_GOSAR|nr:hypothetical protein PVK06_007727 [Gossypium arboreum]